MMTAVADMLAKLIAFDTVSSRSNLGLIHFIRDLLAEQGIAVRVMAAPDGQPKANLWATIGPDKPGGIVLSGHTDVVPVAGQPWSTDPFTLRDGGDRYFGRGTCDMKGFIALCLALLPDMQKQPLKTPIHFAFRADNRKAVDAFHVAAIAAGGRDNGGPGLRANYSPDYYAAFVYDPDGHNVEAVTFSAN